MSYRASKHDTSYQVPGRYVVDEHVGCGNTKNAWHGLNAGQPGKNNSASRYLNVVFTSARICVHVWCSVLHLSSISGNPRFLQIRSGWNQGVNKREQGLNEVAGRYLQGRPEPMFRKNAPSQKHNVIEGAPQLGTKKATSGLPVQQEALVLLYK